MIHNKPDKAASDTIVAVHTKRAIALNAQEPDQAWGAASPVVFCSDWQGKNADLERETQVQILWAAETIYLRFECRYRELYSFEDSEPNGRRDRLWERDVAEAFLQPHDAAGPYYKEFEVSPNGMWIDLDIFPGGLADLKSGLQSSVWLDRTSRLWVAELAIPIKAITTQFDPKFDWRVNFFRVEGPKEPRFYSAWQPTHTLNPNFHVPEAFGRMQFR
jgi:Carbohydrate family 9 binding domain-like